MSTHTSHYAAMNKPLSPPLPYPFLLRVRDAWFVGRRDAQKTLAHEVSGDAQPSASLRGLAAELSTRCEWELLEAVRLAGPLIDEHREHLRVIASLTHQIAADAVEIEGLSVTDPAAYERVPQSEAHLTPQQRRERRDRETHAAVAPLIARRAAKVGQLSARQLREAELAGNLTTLFEALQARVTSLANHYERRASNQIRAYLRRAPGDADHPLNQRMAFEAPAWAAGPNPWLPAEDGAL